MVRLVEFELMMMKIILLQSWLCIELGSICLLFSQAPIGCLHRKLHLELRICVPHFLLISMN